MLIAQVYALGILKNLNGLAQKNWDLFIIFNFMPRMPRCQVIFVINARQARKRRERLFFPQLIFSGRVVCLSVCLSFCLFLKRNYVLISFDLSFSHDVICRLCIIIMCGYFPWLRFVVAFFVSMKLRVSSCLAACDVWQTNVFLTHLFV